MLRSLRKFFRESSYEPVSSGFRIFIWEIFPEWMFPLLTGFSVFCLANPRSTDFTRVFGGSNGNEGLGLLSICFDWQYIAGQVNPLTIPLRVQVCIRPRSSLIPEPTN